MMNPPSIQIMNHFSDKQLKVSNHTKERLGISQKKNAPTLVNCDSIDQGDQLPLMPCPEM